ncbi:predicted protein [Chaetomium globosum CBS 148.51]|uniref:Uncharacterized protein n=1 Tax=Chaetomium globosum (strain ATCC 6205 / CBS 148.51 / DSM 1962 / NBRC 6347 / NRRL 1970) TaxID=306901 RepID=Q2GTI0_CHAGB|nr:uncharacterized protein CHGG_08724 [Chaetomium globosum CBS 148.51]EAQ84710.1 predicted protein [Chaetomium globosum CBS 148.51]
MEPLSPILKTPTRIPRPTFVAASPRTPSIRAVPYNAVDGVTTASSMTGSYSPTSWPFPKSAKRLSLYDRLHCVDAGRLFLLIASRDLPTAATQHCDAPGASCSDINQTESAKSHHRTTASTASEATIIGSFQMAKNEVSMARGRADVSRDSVETQIYAPRHSESNAIAEHPRPNSGGHFLHPATEGLERPMTPTPYSVLRKVSEVSEPGNTENGGDSQVRDEEQQPISASKPQETTHHHQSATHTPRDTATKGPVIDDIDIERTDASSVTHATPVPRNEEGRVLSRLRPLLTATIPKSEPQDAQWLAAPTSSVGAEYGGSDGGNIDDTLDGIIILKSVGMPEAAPNAGASMRNISLYSRRPTTIQSEVPDLESLRLGPRLRHSRLPLSPSMATNAGRSVPRSTKKLWSALARSRRMMFASAVLLELCILNVVASVTAVTASYIEHGYAGIGVVAWAAVSGVFALTFGALLGATFLQYRKMNKDLVSGENWIEMHLRSRPLPPRPQSKDRRQDNGATEAWQKFVQDHTQLRRYVEFLESRIGVLEEGRPNIGEQNNGGTNTAGVVSGPTYGTMENAIGQSNGIDADAGASGDNTPKEKKLNVGGSLSRRQLLQSEDSVTEPESWQGSDGNATISKSDTKASILTELCEAVTEGYSPLSGMPPSSPHTPQAPNNQTPSGRPRVRTLRHLALPSRAAFHRPGAHSVEI